MSECSECSLTSSQLDDIDLAAPQSKTFEHHTDVGYMFGQGVRQPSLTIRDVRGKLGAASPSLARDGESSSFSGDVIRAAAPGVARPRSRGDGAEQEDSSPSRAIGDTEQASGHAQARMSQERSEVSAEGNVRLRDASCSYTVTVDVLSSAFTLTEQAWQQGYRLNKSPAEVISQRACTGLGIDPSSLTYFELTQVPASQLRPSGRYAVAIDRSGALELRILA